jgi:hypothetical protein
MKQFLFSAEITPTGRHTDFWVNDEQLKNLNICAENLKDAMNKFFDLCESAYYPISKHSKTHPSKMYVDLEDGINNLNRNNYEVQKSNFENER